MLPETFLLGLLALARGESGFAGNNSPVVSQLVAESRSGKSLMESEVLPGIKFTHDEAEEAQAYIRSHADYNAYHLLFALRRHAPQDYQRLPENLRAKVLCSALSHLRYLNDWGYLDPSGSYDGEAANALLETGREALDCLIPLLHDEQAAPLFGTEEATMSSTYQYRRKDFAYRYVVLIMREQPLFDPNPEERDREIARLYSRLHKNS